MKLPTFSLTNTLSQPRESKLVRMLVPAFQQKRTQQFTTLTLTMITIIFFSLFAISPTISTIFDLQKQLDDDTFANTQLQTKISNITTLQTKYANVESQLGPVLDALPPSPNIDLFIGQVHTIAQQSNIQVNSMQTLPINISPTATVTAKYLSYEFSLEVQGTFSDIQTFITNVSSFNRLISFENISLSRVGRIDPTFRADLRGRTYMKGVGQ